MRIVLSLVLACIAFSVHSQQRALFQTTKVEGTENVYVFRYGGHQSMFVVTSDGVSRRSRKSATSRSST